jgi:hypothetical protein
MQPVRAVGGEGLDRLAPKAVQIPKGANPGRATPINAGGRTIGKCSTESPRKRYKS